MKLIILDGFNLYLSVDVPEAANQTYVKELEAKLDSINQKYDSLLQQVNFLFCYVWYLQKNYNGFFKRGKNSYTILLVNHMDIRA